MLINMRNALMAGGGKLSAKSYVQDGLVAMWDGIENAGWGVHDASATTWKDITGNGYDGTQRKTTGWEWSADAYVGTSQGGQGFTVPTTFSQWLQASINSHTVELCFKAASIRRMVMFGQFNGSKGLNFEVGPTGNLRVYYSSTPDIYFQVFSDMKAHTCATRCNGSSLKVSVDNVEKRTSYQPASSTILPAVSFILGGEINRTSMSILGSLYRVSVYSRALTSEEIAANYAVDKARFNLPEVTT